MSAEKIRKIAEAIAGASGSGEETAEDIASRVRNVTGDEGWTVRYEPDSIGAVRRMRGEEMEPGTWSLELSRPYARSGVVALAVFGFPNGSFEILHKDFSGPTKESGRLTGMQSVYSYIDRFGLTEATRTPGRAAKPKSFPAQVKEFLVKRFKLSDDRFSVGSGGFEVEIPSPMDSSYVFVSVGSVIEASFVPDEDDEEYDHDNPAAGKFRTLAEFAAWLDNEGFH